jgi:colanic acid biosynthesis protein WcaH
MLINKQQFLEVISRTPLVSIDLVIRDSKNRILLGRRVNEPARGKWFVPGSRILKDESLDDAGLFNALYARR